LLLAISYSPSETTIIAIELLIGRPFKYNSPLRRSPDSKSLKSPLSPFPVFQSNTRIALLFLRTCVEHGDKMPPSVLLENKLFSKQSWQNHPRRAQRHGPEIILTMGGYGNHDLENRKYCTPAKL